MFFLDVCVFMCTWVWVRACECDYHKDQRVFDSLHLELQVFVSYQCGCRKLNLGPLQGHSVVLTMEPSLQPLMYIIFVSHLLLWISNFSRISYKLPSSCPIRKQNKVQRNKKKWPGPWPGILATQKAEARGSWVQGQPRQFSETLPQKKKWKEGWNVAPAGEHPGVWLRSEYSLVWRRLSC